MIKRMLSLQQVVHHRFTAIWRGLAGFQVVDVTDLIRVAGQVLMGSQVFEAAVPVFAQGVTLAVAYQHSSAYSSRLR